MLFMIVFMNNLYQGFLNFFANFHLKRNIKEVKKAMAPFKKITQKHLRLFFTLHLQIKFN